MKNLCGICSRPVAKNHRAVLCEACYFWHHIKCEKISLAEYVSLCGDDKPWICRNCTNFLFSDSFFECDSEPNIAVCDIDSSVQPNVDIFDQLRTARKTFPKRFLCAYLNINSLRYKFDYIKDLLTQNTVDLLLIAETKIEESFVNAQFVVDNYHLWRADQNQKGGGVAAFLMSNIAEDRKSDLEFRQTEGTCIHFEVKLNGPTWLFIGAYKPTSMTDELFEADITILLIK